MSDNLKCYLIQQVVFDISGFPHSNR